jgi:hypothetical protein
MDEHHEGEAPTEMSSAVRSRFWAGLNHASGQQADGQEPDAGEAEQGGTVGRAQESSAPRDQGP